MPVIESSRAFVNAWDCDENDHLNVQVYFRFFEDAAEHYLAQAGLGTAERRAPACRHVRFHSEMRNGQLVLVESFAARAEASGHWHLVHRMVEPATGRLTATALDTYEGGGREAALTLAAGAIPDEAAPRSLPLAPTRMISADPVFRMTHRGRLERDELRADGHIRHRAAVARFSDAAAHFWESVGVAQPWLAERDYGRVAVEMKVNRGAPVKAGLLHLNSAPLATGGKTVSFRHLFIATDTGDVAAVGEVTALLFDREARKAVELPDKVREAVEERMAEASV